MFLTLQLSSSVMFSILTHLLQIPYICRQQHSEDYLKFEANLSLSSFQSAMAARSVRGKGQRLFSKFTEPSIGLFGLQGFENSIPGHPSVIAHTKIIKRRPPSFRCTYEHRGEPGLWTYFKAFRFVLHSLRLECPCRMQEKWYILSADWISKFRGRCALL